MLPVRQEHALHPEGGDKLVGFATQISGAPNNASGGGSPRAGAMDVSLADGHRQRRSHVCPHRDTISRQLTCYRTR